MIENVPVQPLSVVYEVASIQSLAEEMIDIQQEVIERLAIISLNEEKLNKISIDWVHEKQDRKLHRLLILQRVLDK